MAPPAIAGTVEEMSQWTAGASAIGSSADLYEQFARIGKAVASVRFGHAQAPR